MNTNNQNKSEIPQYAVKKILFICNSNKDRSPALAEYFKQTHPSNEYRSCGINKYFCEKNGTNYLTHEDIDWATVIVFCEDIHYKVACEKFLSEKKFNYKEYPHLLIINEASESLINVIELSVLNLGEYKQGSIDEDYLTKAEMKLKELLMPTVNA